MNIEQLVKNISSDQFRTKTIDAIMASKKEVSPGVKQYDIKNHNVLSENLITGRPKKKVFSAQRGPDGAPLTDPSTLQPITITEYRDVVRLPIPEQKLIVKQRTSFLLGNPIEPKHAAESELEKALVEMFGKTWSDNKMDYRIKDVLNYMMSETEVAVICYIEPADAEHWGKTANQGKLEKIRIQILRSNDGKSLFPLFDEYGDMIAFSRAYKLSGIDGKEISYFTTYTAETDYYFEKQGRNWQPSETATTKNLSKKIRVVYFSQPEVESADVDRLIDHKEVSISNHGETNKYFGSPTAVFKGVVKGLPDKDDSGKAIELEGDGAEAKYLTWDQSPGSIELEQKNTNAEIKLHSGTSDISLDKMAGVGAFSSLAIRMLFMNSHLFAANKEGEFGPLVQRLFNVLKALICEINDTLVPARPLQITPKFTYYLPKNDTETLANIVMARNAGIMSLETSVKSNPLIEDGEAEWLRVQAELKAAAPLPSPASPLDEETETVTT